MGFNIQDFIENPSIEKVDSCRKDDLLCIASYYNIRVQKYGVKTEIKKKVMETLIELKVLDVPINVEHASAASSPDDSVLGACASSVLEKQGERLDATPRETAKSNPSPVTMPRYEPFSPEGLGSSIDAKLKVRLTRLQLEANEKEMVRKADYTLQVRKLEIDADKEVKLRQLKIEAMKITSSQTKSTLSHISSHQKGFDVSKNISLVPTFREAEVDSYFNAFERIATALNWPSDMWPILLQCRLVGKAQ